MKSVLICGFVVCALLSTAQSKSYYYRIGREIIVPTVDAEVVKEVVAAELKKDGGVALVEETVPVVGATIDEARADASPAANLEVLEILPASGNPLKSATVAETVKNAAIAAVAENAEVKAEEPAKEAEPAVVGAVKTETAEEPKPVIRQQNLLQQAQETFTNLVQNNPLTNAINSIRNPTTSTPAIAAVADAVEDAASAVAADATTARPPNALLQTIQNTLNNLGSAFQRPATPPAVAADTGTKNGDEVVPIIQQTPTGTVNNKVDIAKSA